MEYHERKKGIREQNLEKTRAQAIVEGDSDTYIKTTLELGYDLKEVPWLAEEPKEKEDLADIVLAEGGEMKNISLKTDKNKEFVEIINSKSYQNIIQGPTRQKLKRIIGDLKRKGYDTPYSPDMDTSGILRCYLNARRDILKL